MENSFIEYDETIENQNKLIDKLAYKLVEYCRALNEDCNNKSLGMFDVRYCISCVLTKYRHKIEEEEEYK